MLNASQKRTNRAPFTDASMSRTPARNAGWFATTPIERPFRRTKPTRMFLAKFACTSKKRWSSTIAETSFFMS